MLRSGSVFAYYAEREILPVLFAKHGPPMEVQRQRTKMTVAESVLLWDPLGHERRRRAGFCTAPDVGGLLQERPVSPRPHLNLSYVFSDGQRPLQAQGHP